jgi:hypothetical protein
MGSCAAPSAKGDDKFITTDYLQQCRKFAAQSRLVPLAFSERMISQPAARILFANQIWSLVETGHNRKKPLL